MRRSKIVCTLGPASIHPETIAAMLRAGMDVVRLNTSHGTMEEHLNSVKLVRRIADEERKPVGILMDLSGPKLRTGALEGPGPVELIAGKAVELTNKPVGCNADCIMVEYSRLTEDVLAGDRVLLDDGKIELEVSQVAPSGLTCRVLTGGLLGAHKGVSFPQTNLTMPALTDRDKEAMAAGVGAGVDFFALSFVRDADDITRARELLNSLGADTPIIAKIERRQAVANLDAILAEADGAMVARGDLGVELLPEEVPIQQRRIIAAAGRNMIPVITATQMLESMVDSPRPTRAESSDVAHAVWDLSDALMLSQETAVGRYPVETVAMMDRIIRRAEEEFPGELLPTVTTDTDDHSYVVALAARRIVESDANMRAIVCFTRSGYTAFLLSKVHANAPVFAISPNESICRRLSLARSVVPIFGPVVDSSEKMLSMVDQVLTEGRHVAEGEEVVVVASLPVQSKGTTNFLKLHTVGESAAFR
jgi:pyruvate kinase